MKYLTLTLGFQLTFLMVQAQYQISGELKTWHKITLDFTGPATSESATINPFSDYRLQVNFTKGSSTFSVPGYFAADGNAAESSADTGLIWRVHFAPDSEGVWEFTVSFHSGTDVAINGGGTPVTPLNGITGQITITASDKSGRDFRGKGRLQYVDQRYLQFAASGEYFLKVGADAPETFLAYEDFDGTPGPNAKSWSPHIPDWQAGDPVWKTNKGKGIIGAINYLAAEGQNAFSFLPMNINGDGKNVWPYINNSTFDRFDCSKLDQWEIVFEHADKLGLYLHFKTQETENDQLLNNGDLGRERKLYYRELIARFSHHLALNWNLGEENTQTTSQRKDMAQYFFDEDPYRHNIVLHTYPGQQSTVYTPLLGSASKLTGASLQTGAGSVHQVTRTWVSSSETAGKPWVVANDEQGGANTGVTPDAGYQSVVSDNHKDIRHKVLWGNFLAGGAGVEYYFGYGFPQSDLTCEDFRSRDKMWDYNRFAHTFMVENIAFEDMVNANELIGNMANDNSKYCLADIGKSYLIYLPNGGSTDLDLAGLTASFHIRWFDPRQGGSLQMGSIAMVSGPGNKSIGTAPNNIGEDWVAWIYVDTLTCPPAGQTCDDGDASTNNDTTDGSCGCAGIPCPSAGTQCNDGNPNTIDDQEDGFCICIGTDTTLSGIWLEAECAIIGSQWSVQSDASASDAKYVLPPSISSLNVAPEDSTDLITFYFEIQTVGIYKLFARTITSNDDNDSFWVRVNLGNWIKWNKINFPYAEEGYAWNQVGEWTNGNQADPLTFNFLAGQQRVDFAWREPGIKFDKLFVTQGADPIAFGGQAINCSDCAEDYAGVNQLTGDVSASAIFQTASVLESIQQISGAGIEVNYFAGESLNLFDGFNIEIGSQLLLEIKDCHK